MSSASKSAILIGEAVHLLSVDGLLDVHFIVIALGPASSEEEIGLTVSIEVNISI